MKDISRKWRPAYNMVWKFDRYAHRYTVLGSKGALSLHISSYGNNGEHTAGLEYHHREPIDGRAPDYARCWLLQGPCWHEGTSLYAEERFLPLHLRHAPGDVLRALQHEAEKYFNGREE